MRLLCPAVNGDYRSVLGRFFSSPKDIKSLSVYLRHSAVAAPNHTENGEHPQSSVCIYTRPDDDDDDDTMPQTQFDCDCRVQYTG